MELSLSSHLLACNSTPSAQPSKAAARVPPASLSGSASRIRLFSAAGSKSRSSMGDSPARSTVALCSAALDHNGASVPEARAIGTGGRIGEVKRVTKETNVSVKINLDGTGVADSSTGIPFLDHMLDQLASHGLFDVHVRATGDIHIDDHHTNEDVALAIGTALLHALGDRKGIHRFGDFSAPLDEALIHVALDLSGRPHLSFDLQIPTQRVGTYDTQLVEHFFQSLVNTSGMTLHIRQLEKTHTILLRQRLKPLQELFDKLQNMTYGAKGLFQAQKGCYHVLDEVNPFIELKLDLGLCCGYQF
ncbi:imidazoleglycerol-phosphate dehydratase 1, chloroplastic-like isoform X3 [Syzygium oleosum]|uniref:imidazoleglycerol-phosphate dehydratase 1, chloroplastic-like isoform X3 n=1 Tax=Syzygium oleosum TaxID=219896 RepID=UPI0024BBE72C|nr:imidazoleglycerol-phosphate dehydratase 1, chloroplastic-like isoform X3 [Syzygium oleosum]